MARGEALVRAGDALVAYLDITRREGPTLTPARLQELMGLAKQFLQYREAAGIVWVPKMHLFLHIISKARIFGNPRVAGSTWIDEGLSRGLAQVAAGAHPAVWHWRVRTTLATTNNTQQ